MRVMVVGANGFIGSAAVARLRASGHDVVAGVRRPSKHLAQQGIEVRVFDASRGSAVSEAMAGITHVINAVMGTPGTLVAVTRNLLDSSVHTAVRRFVHLSSIAVFGEVRGRVYEETPRGQGVNHYGRAKIQSEDLARSAATGDLSIAILRPGCVYGPGSEAWTARIGRLLRAKRLGDLGAAGDGRCNLIFIDDLAEAIAAALVCPIECAAAYNLAEAEPPTWNWYMKAFARSIGAVPVAYVQKWRLTADYYLGAVPLKAIQILAERALRSRTPDPITPSLLRLFRQEVTFDSTLTDRDLRITRTPIADGLSKSARWFLQCR